MVKNRDLGLENAALGPRNRQHFKTSVTVFHYTKYANYIYFCLLARETLCAHRSMIPTLAVYSSVVAFIF